MITDTIKQAILKVLPEQLRVEVQLEHPSQEEHGDYSTNIALRLFKSLAGKEQDNLLPIPPEARISPKTFAEWLVDRLKSDTALMKHIEKIEVAGPGFINFTITPAFFIQILQQITAKSPSYGVNEQLLAKRYMVEFAHPNTHKEMHIGHMRTLTTGEAISRIATNAGAQVFRANYQGDAGLHVAKAIYGLVKIMQENGKTVGDEQSLSNFEKAHLLGQGYVYGNIDYDANENIKNYIDALNNRIYLLIAQHLSEVLRGVDIPHDWVASFPKPDLHFLNDDETLWRIYRLTRQWSLDYYHDFYRRFYTTFDHLFFESQMAQRGVEIIESHVPHVFQKDDGAIIFPGDQYGLHRRVFITKTGNPTYEGKEMGNAYSEYDVFPFDLKVHIVANEQAGYFQVVFKALELLDAEKFAGKQLHVSMGMVHLANRKMSSRTGEILTVDSLIDQVKGKVREIVGQNEKLDDKIRSDEAVEAIAIAAIKYSVLKVGTGQDVAFDIDTSVTMDGDSGPYLQYTYARIRSVLRKTPVDQVTFDEHMVIQPEELKLLRWLARYPEITSDAAHLLAPNMICSYLFELAQRFNLFYHTHQILKADTQELKEFRVQLALAVGNVLKHGLDLLGIKVLEQM